jgi:putative membrane protein
VADTATLLALERTRVAYERTMMAWVRTGTSLITFGFTVYKFFQLDQAVKLGSPMRVGPREFAMALILIGLLALVLGTVEHARDLRALHAHYPQMPGSLSRWVAVVMVLLGVVSLLAVVLHA